MAKKPLPGQSLRGVARHEAKQSKWKIIISYEFVELFNRRFVDLGNLFNPLNSWQKNLTPTCLCEARSNLKHWEYDI